jgi:hypothetical protein
VSVTRERCVEKESGYSVVYNPVRTACYQSYYLIVANTFFVNWKSVQTNQGFKNARKVLTDSACVYLVFVTQQLLVAQDNLIFEASRSHSDTSHSVDSSGLVIRLTQIPVPYNKQKSQETNLQALAVSNQ